MEIPLMRATMSTASAFASALKRLFYKKRVLRKLECNNWPTNRFAIAAKKYSNFPPLLFVLNHPIDIGRQMWHGNPFFKSCSSGYSRRRSFYPTRARARRCVQVITARAHYVFMNAKLLPLLLIYLQGINSSYISRSFSFFFLLYTVYIYATHVCVVLRIVYTSCCLFLPSFTRLVFCVYSNEKTPARATLWKRNAFKYKSLS